MWFGRSLAVGVMLFGGLLACQQRETAPADAPSAPASSEDKPHIAVIPKGTTHDFWKSIHAGAIKAARELDADITWIGPEQEDDRKSQIEVVQNLISRGVDAMVLAPLDAVALARPVETAVQRGIPVVVIDSDLESEAQSCFIATDNLEAGRMAARRLGEVMGGTGAAIMLRYAEGSASTEKREAGFLEVMASDFPHINLLSTNQFAGATTESAFKAAQNLLNKFPDVQGVFCPNESSTFGFLRALQTAGKAGTIKLVGFDPTKPLLDAMRKHEVEGLVSQDPFDMGYKGVKAAVAILRGEPVEKEVPTRLEVVTPENMDAPEILELIKPDLDKWLE